MTLRLELDFAYDEETLDEALFRATQKHEAITYRIEDVHGPGGGWPVIAFFAPDVEHLRAFVYDVYGSGDRVGDEEIVQSAEYVGRHTVLPALR